MRRSRGVTEALRILVCTGSERRENKDKNKSAMRQEVEADQGP